MALTELARFLPRGSHHNRFLRSGMRSMGRRDESPQSDDAAVPEARDPAPQAVAAAAPRGAD